MGWNDRSPWADQIAALQEQYEDEGTPYPESYMKAVEDVSERRV